MQNENTNSGQRRKNGTQPVPLHSNPILRNLNCSDTIELRFWNRVIKTDSCWIWTGGKTGAGYGSMQRGRKGAGQIAATKLSWIIHNGAIPQGMCLCHSCDTPACVNPAHLWLGTPMQNTHDMINKGRAKRGERHPQRILTLEQVETIKEAYGRGGITQLSLAIRYGVDRTTVGKIITNVNWQPALLYRIT